MNRLGFALVTLLVFANAAPADANGRHPNHLSLAEMEYNAKTDAFEVSLAVLALDFEGTLSRRLGKRVNLDRTKGIKKIIEAYLAERFVITLANGKKPKPQYVGREDKGKVVWLYFTMPCNPIKAHESPAKKKKVKSVGSTKSVAMKKRREKRKSAPRHKSPKTNSPLMGARLENRILMAFNDAQFNRVIVREGKWRRTMLFEKSKPSQILRKTLTAKKKEPHALK